MKFSIIIPTHNGAPYIEDAINSLKNQKYNNWEAIIVLDGCRDETESIVNNLMDDRIRMITIHANVGHPGIPRNLGLKLSDGNVICYLDQDDTYDSRYLSTLSEIYMQESIDVVAVGVNNIDINHNIINRSCIQDMIWSSEIQIMGPMFQPSQVSYRRRVANLVGDWTVNKYGLEDWHRWVNITKLDLSFTTVYEHLVNIVKHDDSRIHSMPVKWYLKLGKFPDSEMARRFHENLVKPDIETKAIELTKEETLEWYRDLWSGKKITVPMYSNGTKVFKSWEDLKESLEKYDYKYPWPPLRAVPQADGSYLIGIDIYTPEKNHAQAIESILEKRFRGKLQMITSILQESGGVKA